MILNDKQIIQLVESNDLISPFYPTQIREVEEKFFDEDDKLLSTRNKKVISYGLSSFGYDIRACPEWKVFTNVYGNTIVDPKAFDSKGFISIFSSDCVIPANSFALAVSMERIQMPENVTGLCIGKSTYARCGIIVNVTPIEAGWEGYITIEISNTTPLPVKVYGEEGIAQILFFQGNIPEVSYASRSGKYMQQPKEIILPRL